MTIQLSVAKSSYLLVLIFLFFFCCKSEQEDSQPNILLICVDDMGWSDLGCYGSEINTPNIDKIAAEGMRFRNCYNTSKCFPSRACLLTGVYAQDCGYDKTHKNPIRNAVTLGEVLKKAGYNTFWSGKHHGLENPTDRGFDRYFGLKDGACNHFNPGLPRPGEPKPAQKRNDREWAIDSMIYKPYTPADNDFYSTDYFTNYAIDYLKENKKSGKPFFLYLAYTAPHDPLMAWPDDIEKYKGKYNKGYGYIRGNRYEKQFKLGIIDSTYQLSEATYKSWDSLSTDEMKYEAKVMEVYAAMIDRIDQNIGRVLKQLEKSGYLENTIIFFVSDNGASAEVVGLNNDNDLAPIGSMGRWISLGADWANVANTPFRYYKNYSFEGGINTPFIAYWPEKIKPNSFSDFPGHFIDFMPTLLEISNAEYPEIHNGQFITPLRGQSLVPVFNGTQNERTEPLFWEWKNGQAMRLDDWKIVRNNQQDRWSLYNIKNDPTEINDLSVKNIDLVQKLDSIYHKWNGSLVN